MKDFKDIPGRAFLDTSSLNFILEYGDCIFDGISPPEKANKRVTEDIMAFHKIFLVGKRATWQLAISPFTYKEVISTQDPKQKHFLEKWFMQVWGYWLDLLEKNNDLPSFIEAEHIKIRLLSSGILDILPDIEDRMLICDALVYRCNCFCTRDWKTILKHRNQLATLPIQITTPLEWWKMIEPYARLWI